MQNKTVCIEKALGLLFAATLGYLAMGSLSSAQEPVRLLDAQLNGATLTNNTGGKKLSARLDPVAGRLTVGTPVSHGNLTVYLLDGEDFSDTSKVLTLGEAMAREGSVIVTETSNVNQLSVRSKAEGKSVFLMAGDIVKGGKQDRTLGNDLPLETKAGDVPIQAFCVEHGRWQRRGAEDAGKFSSSYNAVASKDCKLAIRGSKNQGEVWKSVEVAQGKISGNVGKVVANAASPTSLQLSLEDADLKKKNAEGLAALLPIVERDPKAIGFAVVINGEINSVEIFAGHDLLQRTWPKFAEAAAIEAVSELKSPMAAQPVTAAQIKEFIASADNAPANKEQIHDSYWSVSAETDSLMLFETIDEDQSSRWLRRSLLKK